VGTEFLNITKVNYALQTQSCGSGPYSLAFQLGGPFSVPCQSAWDLWWTKWQCDIISTGTSVFPCEWPSAKSLYLSWSTWCSYQIYKRSKPRNIPTSSAVSEIWKNSIGKWFYLAICFVIFFLFTFTLHFTSAVTQNNVKKSIVCFTNFFWRKWRFCFVRGHRRNDICCIETLETKITYHSFTMVK
jgi:hypothetical protein